MKNIEELENIAVLIDADNAQLGKLKLVLDEISSYGRIVVKKAFGNWKDPILKNWEEIVKTLAIKPEQQFAYTKGKNATDISMVINAMDLLHTGSYDAFALVASDSDYTPLAIRLRESGVFVFGVGEKKTPASFKNACDEFISTELLSDLSSDTSDDKTKSNPTNEMDLIHDLLKKVWIKHQDGDGFANVSSAGSYIKRVKPDFNTLTFGFQKLPDLISSFPDKYEMTKYRGKGTVRIVAYKCK